ncbi:MAG: RNA polymerase sigma factor [Lysobacteraceae bacterium]|nr:MAG: RNA polymerase sigma factor [Xanthomonadaceae bacterium]
MSETERLQSSDPALAAGDALRDPAELAALRSRMLRFATLQLGDPQLAEDAVQEALVAAMTHARSFAGRAAYRTWVFAILKNKIADLLRQRSRSLEAARLGDGEEENGEPEGLFDARGHWQPHERPRDWHDPEAATGQAEFWRIFEACLDRLPGRQAQVFMMREFVGLETAEICAATGLGVSNVHVILHRARLRLRECLEDRWFGRERPC